jgi:hypothetical protein
MELVLAAVLGGLVTAVATVLIGWIVVASAEVDRRDRQIRERDEDLEEWIIVRHRELKQRWDEIESQAVLNGVERGGTIPAGRAVVQTIALYEYREELRQARNFVLRLEVEERWVHRVARRVKKQPFPGLTTPDRAVRLIDSWSEGTARNALTWRLEDILTELPERATSRALAA